MQPSAPEGVTDCIQADLGDPEQIVRAAAETLDFDQPTAVTMLGVLRTKTTTTPG